MNTLQEILRAETRLEHDEIEKVINLSSTSFTLDMYQHLLKSFYGFYLPVEKELEGFRDELQRVGLDLEERLKLPLIKNDLLFLGSSLKHLGVDDNAPAPKNLAQALGVLYVLEGSTLGGQVIHQRLIASGIFPEERKVCFHYPYGPLTRKKWEEFKVVLNALPEMDFGDALFMAKTTFTGLQGWIKTR